MPSTDQRDHMVGLDHVVNVSPLSTVHPRSLHNDVALFVVGALHVSVYCLLSRMVDCFCEHFFSILWTFEVCVFILFIYFDAVFAYFGPRGPILT